MTDNTWSDYLMGLFLVCATLLTLTLFYALARGVWTCL